MRLALTVLFVASLWSVGSSDDPEQGRRNDRGGRRGHKQDRGGQGKNNNRGGGRPEPPRESLYALSEDIGGTCPPRDSCKALFQLRGTRTWNERLCDCGPECIRFGSCCADSPFAGMFPPEPAKNEECQQPPNFRTYYAMVAKCDDEFQWPEAVRVKCESREYADGEPLHRNVPLTSVGTLTTYRNYYCAACNYGGSDLIGWEVEVPRRKMPDNKDMKRRLKNNAREYNAEHIVYDAGKKSFVITDASKRNAYPFSFVFRTPPYLRTRVHRCHPELRQTCKPEYAEFQQLCHAYYSPVKLDSRTKDRTYRNMHCAMCRGMDASTMKPRECKESTKGGEDEDDDEEESREKKDLTVFDFNQYGDSDKKQKYVQVPDCGRTSLDEAALKSCKSALCVLSKSNSCQ